MRVMRVGTLQWAVGAFSSIMGTMMLVAPHQFRIPEYASIRILFPWIGFVFVAAAVALLVVATLRARGCVSLGAHLIASVGLLALSADFTMTGIWTGTISYLILGVATAAAHFLGGAAVGRETGRRGDLFAAAIGLSTALQGLLFLLFPSVFTAEFYEVSLPYLTWYGAAFLASGLALLSVQLLPSVSTAMVWAAGLSVAGSFFAFGLPHLFNNTSTWSGAVYYGGFGILIAFLPHITSRWGRVDLASFRARLALALAVSVAIPSVLIGSVETEYGEQFATKEALSRQQLQAGAVSRQFIDHFSRHRSVAIALAAQPELLTMGVESRRALLQSLKSALPDPVTLAVLDANGNEIARSDDRPLGIPNLVGSSILSDVRNGRSASTALISTTIGQAPVMVVGARMEDEGGRFSGMVVVRADISLLSWMLSRESSEPEETRFLVDGSGRLLARSGAREATLEELSGLPPVAALLAGTGEAGSVSYAAKGGEMLTGYARIPGSDWGVVVEQSKDRALGAFRIGRDLASRILLLVIGLSIVVGSVSAGLLATQLRAFTVAMERLGAGDAKAPIPYSGISEFSRLATVFREMRERLGARTAESERAVRALRARERQQAAVAQIGQWALAGTELQTLLNGVVALVALTLDVPYAKLLELLPHGQSFKLRAVVGLEDELSSGVEVPSGRASQAGYALMVDEPVIVEDLSVETRFSSPPIHSQYGLVSGMSVLVSGRERAFGVLSVHTTSRRTFTQDDVHFLQSVANHLAMVIDRMRSEEAQSFLAEASGLLASSLDCETVLGSVARLAVPRLADWCSVDVLDEAGVLQRVTVAHVDPAKERLLEELLTDHRLEDWPRHHVLRVVSNGLPLLFDEVPDSMVDTMGKRGGDSATIREIGMKSAAILPLRARGRTLGAITLVSASTSHRYSQSEMQLAEELARRCAMAVDNTRLYQESREAVRARDEFLSVAAHELKTPVTSLRGYAQLSLYQMERDGELNAARALRAFQVIDSQSQKLSKLVGQLLDVSRMEAGRLVLERQSVDLVALVEGVVVTAQPTTTSHTIIVRAPGSVQATVDPLRLEQVVTNLVDNAIKYSPAGGQIEVRLSGPEGGAVRLEVRDHGLGVPPEHRQRIFDRFYQAHSESHRGGMGLGLYISQLIAQLHGGRIDVESPTDGGTRFVLSLPVSPNGEGAGDIATRGEIDGAYPGGG
jgi:signal transduction histidine kinase